MTSTQDQTAMAKDLCDAVGPVLGSYPGNRVTHTKGVNLTGTFTATPRARELTRAAHMQGDPIRVLVRFSNGNPNPRCPDAAQDDPRGIAVKFHLPDGSKTDIACQIRRPDPAHPHPRLRRVGASAVRVERPSSVTG